MHFIKTYCDVNDHYKANKSQYQRARRLSGGRRDRESRLTTSEIGTIILCYQWSGFRTFKKYYGHLLEHYRHYFPNLVSYSRFVEIQAKALALLSGFLGSKTGKCTGISFIDSTPLAVCNIKRSASVRVFKGIAAKGKSSKGWFYGFKLHLVVNHHGQPLAAKITPGNVHDLVPVEGLTKRLFGKLFGDKGYLSKNLFESLFQRGIQLFSGIRKTMKNKLIDPINALLMKKRSLIESVYNSLKHTFHVEHSRYRNVTSFFINILAALSAYSVNLNRQAQSLQLI